MHLHRRRRFTEEDIVERALMSDISHWRFLNRRCPTCLAVISELPTDESIYPHMIGECEQVVIGPNWVRRYQNVQAPLAKPEENREVKAPRTIQAVTGRVVLYWSLFFLSVAAFGLWVIFR